MGIPHWAPIDIAIDEAHDILSDAFFTRLLRLAWSGRIALLVAAPPCRDYSVLKLAPGGPLRAAHPSTSMACLPIAQCSHAKPKKAAAYMNGAINSAEQLHPRGELGSLKTPLPAWPGWSPHANNSCVPQLPT